MLAPHCRRAPASEESVGALVLRGGVCGLLTVSPIRIEECFAALVLHKICEAHGLAVVGWSVHTAGRTRGASSHLKAL